MSDHKRKVIIYVGERSTTNLVKQGENKIILVRAPDPASAAELAVDQVNQGADCIELCGGTGFKWLTAVKSAIDNRIPIGLVTYPFESITGAANFKARYESGGSQQKEGEVFLVLADKANPNMDRIKQKHEAGWTTFVAVSGKSEAAEEAKNLHKKGATLIELYGGLNFTDADIIHEATDGQVPVGVASYYVNDKR
ncbi:hypothetical protein SAMN05443144_105203 [Fodinibius roseus]|uniref:Uncharacterized protein n=1 Tax=Fodinibius roseus TaxID=1194090 RepID=A0A1M4YZE2_9BACT|nr:DUF6506 family protein [Fodinibius roseus]SHF11171.1 hypothetical protein SAMN05443144_105203 [Fodinibius roseus]